MDCGNDNILGDSRYNSTYNGGDMMKEFTDESLLEMIKKVEDRHVENNNGDLDIFPNNYETQLLILKYLIELKQMKRAFR